MNAYSVASDFQGTYATKRVRTKYIVVHHAAALYPTGTGLQDVRAVAKYHTVDKGWPGIGYHICLAEETNGGPIARYDVSDLDLQRAHILNRNHECVGVSCLTNFKGLPEQKWIDALVPVLKELKQRYPQAQIVGHKEIAVPGGETTCPGPRWHEWKQDLLFRVVAGHGEKGLTFRHAPRISRAVFARVLAERNSPCAPFADECYSIIERHSLDPAVALAFFAHESEYGTTGIAPLTRNWGNVRQPMDVDRTTGMHPRNFAIFRTWQDGLEDWCQRINERYIGEWGLDTVEKAVPKYAPSSDGNVPQSYINHVIGLVARWEKESAMQGKDYQLSWGNAVPYRPEFAIPSRWRAELDRGNDLGAATTDETSVGAFQVQAFTHGVIVFKDGDTEVAKV